MSDEAVCRTAPATPGPLLTGQTSWLLTPSPEAITGRALVANVAT